MVPINHFNRIVYKRLRHFRPPKSLKNVIGFDSEAYTTGETFIFCTSNNHIITPESLIDALFTDFAPCNFVTWNLKYESGAILKCFPLEVIQALQKSHKTIYIHHGRKLEISYIAHKRLRIRHITFAGKSVNFWDMSPFYGRCKLETAGSTYLGVHKLDTDVSLFTKEYVTLNHDTISKYCIQDASITKQLADLWISNFEKTGIPVSSLYSEASISFSYIANKTEIVTPWEFWEYNRKAVKLAFESYEGGKFEITARGKFTGYEYDISSAYPYEISNLLDIRGSRVVYSKHYERDARYAFLRCLIHVTDPTIHLPCGIFHKLRVYPMGTYYLTITKQEYDYITKEIPSGVHIDILDGVWLILPRFSYPYKAIFNELYGLKTHWKKKDRLRSNNYKIIMNGFYGKAAQCQPSMDGKYIAGPGWNPIYASVITANTRIAVTRLQNLLKSDCLAVHTDSAITLRPIPDKLIGSGLGQFELVEHGDGVLVACGIYEINGQCALKGFRKHSITKLLSENPGKEKIILTLKHVESWLQAMAQNHPVSNINLFSDVSKILTLNCDTKRQWLNNVTSTDLLESLQYSTPLSYYENNQPDFWDKK